MRTLVDWLDHNVADGVAEGGPAVSGFDEGREGLEAAVARSCAGEEEWPARVVAALRSALGYAADHPDLARLLAIDSAEPGSPHHGEHREMIERFAARLAAGAPRAPVTSSERALVVSVVGAVAARLRAGEERSLLAAVPQLAFLLLVPYVGFDDARALASG